MSDEIYVKMTSREFDMFREMKPLANYTPSELASALLESMKRSGAEVLKGVNISSFSDQTQLQLTENNFRITLTITKL